jgi:hypothetical protein
MITLASGGSVNILPYKEVFKIRRHDKTENFRIRTFAGFMIASRTL